MGSRSLFEPEGRVLNGFTVHSQPVAAPSPITVPLLAQTVNDWGCFLMNNGHNDRQKENLKKRWICLLIIALTTSSLSPIIGLFSAFPMVPMIAGTITGGVALFMVRKKISRVGLTISVIAIIWSVAWLLIYIRIIWLISRGLFP